MTSGDKVKGFLKKIRYETKIPVTIKIKLEQINNILPIT